MIKKHFYWLLFFTSAFLIPSQLVTAQTEKTPYKEKDFTAYLFCYFPSNAKEDEAVHYAVSLDGYHFYTLNNNKPVIKSSAISLTGGVRDPHILRGEDGNTFYMACTDMVCSQGWESNRAMVLLKSTDLINWTSSNINIPEKYSGQEDLHRVWAPQTIFDKEAEKYMVYWSMKYGDKNDVIYYAYANDDFTDLEGEPAPLYIPESGDYCIDGDIIYKDSTYYLFHKTGNDAGSGIKVSATKSLTSGNWTEDPEYKQQTKYNVEGSGVFKLNNTEEYILMYDVYKQHVYQFTKTTDFKTFEVVDEQIQLDFTPRHGTILPITRNELKHLLAKWGTPDSFPALANNPVLEGYYADPEIIYSEKHKKFFMYPTTDGITNWLGTYFETFSSDNLVDWKKEGVILDLATDVSWANHKAWAPYMMEKKTENGYRYFYYYTAEHFIGVATSANPFGKFTDSGKRIIDKKPEGINRGIEIDPAVFHDPVSGNDYLYWGNGYMAVVELNDDMVSYKPESLKIITPDGTFREGTSVFYRKGKYYFLWSENDTRSVDYRVRYGIGNSPTGPIVKPENNLVIAKNANEGIYGTGHNSVINVPGTDDWYIVYHRFSYPNGIKMGREAGYHREVCIDKLTFEENGEIIQVTPTHQGILPVQAHP